MEKLKEVGLASFLLIVISLSGGMIAAALVQDEKSPLAIGVILITFAVDIALYRAMNRM